MKEKIYTIPVNEAFDIDSECALCTLEKKLEDESLEYVLGPFMMEPDGREITDEKGFCHRHFELLYNGQSNKLNLGLIIDTHMVKQNRELKAIYQSREQNIKKDSDMGLFKSLSNLFTFYLAFSYFPVYNQDCRGLIIRVHVIISSLKLHAP